MQVEVDIEFNKLLKIIKTLPQLPFKQLKEDIEKEAKKDRSVELQALLLAGPAASKEQLKTIAKNRNDINQWRAK